MAHLHLEAVFLLWLTRIPLYTTTWDGRCRLRRTRRTRGQCCPWSYTMELYTAQVTKLWARREEDLCTGDML